MVKAVKLEPMQEEIKLPNPPGVNSNQNELSPSKFRIFKEKTKNAGLSINDVFTGMRSSPEIPPAVKFSPYGSEAQFPVTPQPFHFPSSMPIMPYNMYNQHVYSRIPFMGFSSLQQAFHPSQVVPSGIQPYALEQNNTNQLQYRNFPHSIQSRNSFQTPENRSSKKHTFLEKKVTRVSKRKQVFLSRDESKQSISSVKRRNVQKEMGTISRSRNMTEESIQFAKSKRQSKSRDVCLPLVDESVIKLLPHPTVDALFKKTVEKLKSYRGRSGVDRNQSPKTDPNTADIFRSKTLLYRRLRSLDKEGAGKSEAGIYRVSSEEITGFETVEQAMEWKETYTSTN